MQDKLRLDAALVGRGLAASRERAKSLITTGLVLVNGLKIEKVSHMVDEDDAVELRGKDLKYVSRGGLKLEKAVEAFGLRLEGAVCGDIGAATGGFTDCMLQNGAVRVYCVDVGYGQLAWKLRCDDQVVNLERTNIRYLEKEQIPELLDFVSIDVSFISLTLVLPVVFGLLKDTGSFVCLIKPQFEAGKGKVGKKGVVREPEIHEEVVRKICDFVTEQGIYIRNIDFSPVKGPEGNIEYLLYGTKNGESIHPTVEEIRRLVVDSHKELTVGEGG